MSPCRLHSLACVHEWHFPRGCACSPASVFFLSMILHMCFLGVRMHLCVCVCACVCVCLNKLTLESFIIGPVSAVSLPEGNEVEMRDRETHGRAASTRGCHTAVPNGGHTGHYDVFQMDTSVCFPGNKSAKSRGESHERALSGGVFICLYPP